MPEPTIRACAAGAACAALLLTLSAAPAQAQLGSVNNPPPQHLFNMDQPQRLNEGVGTMAERRQQLARSKRAVRPLRQPVPLPR